MADDKYWLFDYENIESFSMNQLTNVVNLHPQ